MGPGLFSSRSLTFSAHTHFLTFSLPQSSHPCLPHFLLVFLSITNSFFCSSRPSTEGARNMSFVSDFLTCTHVTPMIVIAKSLTIILDARSCHCQLCPPYNIFFCNVTNAMHMPVLPRSFKTFSNYTFLSEI